MNPELSYSAPFFISAFSIFVVGIFIACRQRRPRGTWYVAALCFAATLWAVTEGMLYLGLGTETNMRITYVQHLGAVPLPPLALLFTLSFFGYDRWLTRKTVSGLFAAALLILLLIWTNPLHHQVYRDYFPIDTGMLQMLGLDHGPLWWAIMGFHYALTALVAAILYRTMRTDTAPLRRQAALFLFLVCLVWVSNGIYVFGFSPVPNMDLGPLAFILVAVAMARGFYRHNFLGIHPIAKAAFFSTLEDPILVLDVKKRLLDLNPAAESLLGVKASGTISREIGHILERRLRLDRLPETPSNEVLPISMNGEERYFEMRTSVLRDKSGSIIGHIYIFRDVTELKHADDAMREHERLSGVLEIAGSVCRDMARPLETIASCARQVLDALPEGHTDHEKGVKLAAQAKRLEEIARKLMGTTRYKTRNYLGGSIIDIERASMSGDEP